MKLRELSAATDTPVPSIKYYLRIGLLAPGEKKNQTTAVYGSSHVARLELIAGLRRIIGVPIDEIARLTALIDDADVPVLTVLEAAQVMGSGLSPGSRPQGSAESDASRTYDRVTELMRQRDWPDTDSAARAAVEQILRDMAALGLTPPSGYLERVTAALDEISRTDLDVTAEGATEAGDQPGWRDRIALRVAVGTHQFSRLVLALLRLGHTSHSIRRFEDRTDEP